MKCKACNGRGVLVAAIYENDEIGFVDKTYQCFCCRGTGEIEQTNDEWRKSCSEEEFINWLVGVCNLAVLESTYNTAQLRKKRYWEIWLKGVHKHGK